MTNRSHIRYCPKTPAASSPCRSRCWSGRSSPARFGSSFRPIPTSSRRTHLAGRLSSWITSPLHRGPGVVPPEGNLHWPPCFASFFVNGDRPKPNSRTQKKTMKTKSQKQKSGLKSRTEQLNTKQLPKIDLEARRANRALKTENLLALLRNQAPKFFERAEVIGRWVWVQLRTWF